MISIEQGYAMISAFRVLNVIILFYHIQNMLKRTDDTFRRLSELSICTQSTNDSSKPSFDSFHIL